MCFKYVVTIFVLLFLVYPSSAWLSGFDYRTDIQINNTDVNAIYHIYNFTVDTAALIGTGKMQSNGSDCWITDVNDNLLPMWAKDDAFNTSNTKIEVNATTLGNLTNTTHYIYYGKSSAVTQINGSAVFPFFSNFNSCPMPNSSISLSILNTTSMGGSSCSGGGDLYKAGDDEYWLLWQYDPASCEHEGKNISHNIYPPNNQSAGTHDDDYLLSSDLTHKTVLRIGDPFFEKMGDIYYVFFTVTWTDGTYGYVYKNSTTGEPQSYGNVTYWVYSEDSAGGSSLKINDSTYWVFYQYKNASTARLVYREFNVTTGIFSDENLIRAVTPPTQTHHHVLPNPYKDPDSTRIFFYYSDITAAYVQYVIYTDNYGASWSSPVQTLPNAGAPVPVIKMNATYYHFYRDDTDNYYMKVATSTDGINNLVYRQTLHSITYSCPQSLEKLNDTHIILYWQKGSCPAGQTAEIDIIEFITTNQGSFDGNNKWYRVMTGVGGHGIATVINGVLKLNVTQSDAWGGEKWGSNASFTRPYIYEWTEKKVWSYTNEMGHGILMNDTAADDAYYIKHDTVSGDDLSLIRKQTGAETFISNYNWVNDENYHDYRAVLNASYISVYMDDVLILHGADSTYAKGILQPRVCTYTGTSERWYDDIRIRDCMDIPPTVSLGSEESAPSVSNETIIVVIL